MAISLGESARHLWRTAPYWRLSVAAAGACVVAGVCYLGSLAVGVPQSDTRLAAYLSVWRRARNEELGEKCEGLASALGELSPEDLRRSAASAKWSAAVAEGQQCREQLEASDSRLAAFARAVSAAKTNPSGAEAAARAFESLDSFDRSRRAFVGDAALVASARGYEAEIAASDRRLASLARQVGQFERTRSGESALGVAGVLNGLTPVDRERSASGARLDALNAAEQVNKQVQAGRSRLSEVGRAAQAAQADRTPGDERQLIEAVAAVTPFDEAVGTEEQKRELGGARAAATEGAWTRLRETTGALGGNATPAAYEAAAIPFEFLSKAPLGALNADQENLLSRGRAAAEAIGASDARLAGLVRAEQVWQQKGMAGGDVIERAYAAVTPFDRARFDERDTQAWTGVSRANDIVEGPRIGLTAATKERVGIFIVGSDKSAFTAEVVESLQGQLRRAGFAVESDEKDSALIATVKVESVADPRSDLGGGFLEWVSTARMGIGVRWAVNDAMLFSDDVVETARTRDEDSVRAQALLAGVGAIVGRFQKAAGG